jgi:hypothetical protein
MGNVQLGREALLKISAIFAIKNQVELVCTDTGKVYYFKFFSHQSVQAKLKVGDFFQIKRDRFHVLRQNRSRVQGLTGALDSSRQLLLFEAVG